MDDVKFSIVIPVYNSEKYVIRCLKSVQSQSLKSFQAIVVDDGSSDSSAALIKEFIKNDSRFTYVHKDHTNAGEARNLGLSMAVGEYILFLDSDDFICSPLLRTTYRALKSNKADVCVYRSKFYFEKDGTTQKAHFLHYPIMLGYHNSKIRNKYLRMFVCGLKYLCSMVVPFRIENPSSYEYIFNFISPSPWNKVFKRELLVSNNLQFQSISRTNDLYCVFSAMVNSKRIVSLNKFLIYYSKNSDSLQDTKIKSPRDCFTAMEKLKEYLVSSNLFEGCKRSYDNYLLSLSMGELNFFRYTSIAEYFYNLLKDEILQESGILDQPKEYFYGFNSYRYEILSLMKKMSFEEFCEATKERKYFS